MSRNRMPLALAIAGSTVILVTALGGWPNVMGAPSPAQSIVGSWVGHPRGAEGFASEPILITFTSDGIVLWSSSNPYVSGGHGVWVSTGNRTVAVTYIFYVHNVHGDFTGTRKVRGKITLNTTYDAYHSIGTADFFDAQGTPTGSADFIGDGSRIKAEPPR